MHKKIEQSCNIYILVFVVLIVKLLGLNLSIIIFQRLNFHIYYFSEVKLSHIFSEVKLSHIFSEVNFHIYYFSEVKLSHIFSEVKLSHIYYVGGVFLFAEAIINNKIYMECLLYRFSINVIF